MTFFCENKGILKNVPVVVLDPIDDHCILHGCSMMVHRQASKTSTNHHESGLFRREYSRSEREKQFDKKQFKDPSGLTEKRKGNERAQGI